MRNKNKRKFIKPFLKWAGGKFRLLPELELRFPKNAKRFIEPFAGAASVSLNVDYPIYIVSDANHDLIDVFVFLRQYTDTFIDLCRGLFTPENNSDENYYKLRDEFTRNSDDSVIDISDIHYWSYQYSLM